MAENLERHLEPLENTSAGLKSKEAIQKEMSISAPTPGDGKSLELIEKEDIIKELEASTEITNVEVGENLDNATFLYKNRYSIKYEGLYDMDKIHLDDKSKAGDEGYSFQFLYSLFKDTLGEHRVADKDDHKRIFLARLDFCIKAQEDITRKLDAEGMKLAKKEEQYVRGEKYKEDKIYFAGQKPLKVGDKGYKEGKEKYDDKKYYFMLQLQQKNNLAAGNVKPVPENSFKTIANKTM